MEILFYKKNIYILIRIFPANIDEINFYFKAFTVEELKKKFGTI